MQSVPFSRRPLCLRGVPSMPRDVANTISRSSSVSGGPRNLLMPALPRTSPVPPVLTVEFTPRNGVGDRVADVDERLAVEMLALQRTPEGVAGVVAGPLPRAIAPDRPVSPIWIGLRVVKRSET